MSRQVRYRLAALTLCGLIFGGPLLMSGTASAEQVEAEGRHVSFGGGGVLGLSCGSRPSVESMTVPASSVVRVVNQTGHDAQLRLAGAPKGTIPAAGAAEVVFRRGTTAVLLTPDCAIGEDALPLLITAAPSSSAEPGPTSPPASGGASATMSKPAGSGSPARTSAGAAMPDSVASGSRPGRTSAKDPRRGARRPAVSRPAAAQQSAATTAPAMPQGDADPRTKVKTQRGTAGVGSPAFAGMPLGDGRTLVPSDLDQPMTVPSTDEADDVLALADSGGPGSFDAAEPVAAVGRIEEGHPLGLLGLTALVCILGVTTAAIRAIVSQRASRTNMA
jgi:hypothetical protein